MLLLDIPVQGFQIKVQLPEIFGTEFVGL